MSTNRLWVRQIQMPPTKNHNTFMNVLRQLGCDGFRFTLELYDRKEYERRVKAVLEGNILESTIRETANMLGRQIDLLNGIPLDVLRNNSNKLVNQDMDVTPLEDINRSAENALHQVAGNILTPAS